MIKPGKSTRMERVIHTLLTNMNGFSEREGVLNLNLTSGRNDINKLERTLDIKFNREWEKTADGRGRYYRYTCPDRKTAEKLIALLNNKAKARGAEVLSLHQQESILAYFK